MIRIFSNLIAVLALILTVPVLLIIVTWNTLPGESFYSVKRTLEEIPRIIFSKGKLAATYEVEMTNRRFDEASALLKTDKPDGLYELYGSIDQAKDKVIQSKNSVAKKQLIKNLNTYRQSLAIERRNLESKLPPKTDAKPPSQQNNQNSNSPTQQTVQAIDDTQNKIDQTEDELKKDKSDTQNKSSSDQGVGTPPGSAKNKNGVGTNTSTDAGTTNEPTPTPTPTPETTSMPISTSTPTPTPATSESPTLTPTPTPSVSE